MVTIFNKKGDCFMAASSIVHADAVCGLGFGDEGKGVTTARLTRAAAQSVGADNTAVVRCSGGPQNAHTVCMRAARDGAAPDRHCIFAQIGSGSAYGAHTFTAEFVPVNPVSLFIEAEAIAGCGDRDEDCARLCAGQHFHGDSPLILPFHEQISRRRERRLRHGSTGRGIFEANKFAELYPDAAPRLRDLSAPKILREKTRLFLQWANAGMPDEHARAAVPEALFADADADRAIDDFVGFCEDSVPSLFEIFLQNVLPAEDWLRALRGRKRLIFEGGQGVLLDRRFGFFPNVTFADTTPVGAARVLDRLGARCALRIHGVTRTYATRHGAGLLPHEIFEDAPHFRRLASAEKHNAVSFAGRMRFAPLSEALLDYAVRLCALDACALTDIHVTCCDVLPFRAATAATAKGAAATGRETADRVFALSGDDAKRRDAVRAWGRALASSETRMSDRLPPSFENCRLHFYGSPFAEEGVV
jgi:adenylosuccinate synthase